MTEVDIGPQPGPQDIFLACSADICIYGGAAGGGKTYALILEPLHYILNTTGFGAVIFRRTTPQIRNEGGLWDTSELVYPYFQAEPKESTLEWLFPNGNRIKFAHLEYEKNVLDWQGSQVPLICFDELTHFCLHPDTEILTEGGWKLITEVKISEKVASLNISREIEYKNVLDTQSFDYHGNLICVNQRNGVSFKATPNHEMLIRRQDKNKNMGKKRLDRWAHDTIIRSGKWKGHEIEFKVFNVPTGRGHGTNSNSIEKVSMDTYLQFLGWYFSEGCCFEYKNRTSTPKISIRQINEKYKQELRDLFSSLGYRWKEEKDGQFNIFSRQLFKELVGYGNTYTKRIPRWVFKLSPRQINIFLDAFKNGDGYEADGDIHYGLANKGLIDDLQELYFLSGRISASGYSKTKTGFDVWRLNVSKNSRTDTMVKNHSLYKEEYHGKVHCLTVEGNHNFLIRYNGKACFSGNSEKQFTYMMSRNRSTCGVKPYIRATCNPDADSWVAKFIEWWIDQKTGFPITERAGVIRWFIRLHGEIIWGDTREELLELYPKSIPKSITFIPAKLSDNKILEEKDPGYRANLQALSLVDNERLEKGNWKIKPEAGTMFRREWFEIIDEAPPNLFSKVRFWDMAGTEKTKANNDPDWTAGVKMARDKDFFYILDIVHVQMNPTDTDEVIKKTLEIDGYEVIQKMEQEPGSSGKKVITDYEKGIFRNYNFEGIPSTGSKVARANRFSAAAGAKRIKLLRGPWIEAFIQEAEHFPDGPHDDQVDGGSGAYNYLSGVSMGKAAKSPVPEKRHSYNMWENERVPQF